MKGILIKKKEVEHRWSKHRSRQSLRLFFRTLVTTVLSLVTRSFCTKGQRDTLDTSCTRAGHSRTANGTLHLQIHIYVPKRHSAACTRTTRHTREARRQPPLLRPKHS